MTPDRHPLDLTTCDPILFDLDGTLTASGPGILASVRFALGTLGRPIPEDSVLSRFVGPPLQDSFREITGLDDETAHEAIRVYRQYYVERGQFENSVYDQIPEVLTRLGAAGRTLAVATSKAEVYARSILAHFDLDRHFVVVTGSELDGRRTAKSEVIAETLTRLRSLGAPTGAPVMIGDRSHDVVGAGSLGVPCIGALWGYGSPAELSTAGAVTLAARPGDLDALLLA